MADSKLSVNNVLSKLDPSLTQSSPSTQKKNEVGKDQFLQLLVTQLQNQDPLDPMKNEDFAVNLAQFSQLEQLVDINNKTSASSGTDISTMASYLGHQVLLGDSTVTSKGGSAGQVSFELDGDAKNVTLELLDKNGVVKETHELGELKAGDQTVNLDGLNVANGEYTVKVSALTAAGIKTTPAVYASGIVSGFVPGPEPVLLINGNEVDPADIKEVRAVA